MHVPWNWIKQRPHFIAEHLSKFYKITVFCKINYRSKNLVQNPLDTTINKVDGFVLPFARFRFVQRINTWILRRQVAKLMKTGSIIWITDPLFFEVIADLLLPSNFLIFDCMDDARSFPLVLSNPPLRDRLIDLEGRLCKRSDLIITSSANLKSKLIVQYGADPGQICIVNNAATTAPGYTPVAPQEPHLNSTKRIVYIGTISEWFDFGLILEALSQVPSIEFHLFGPIEVRVPVHPALKCWGPVLHDKIFEIMGGSDCLVMPFLPTDLVMSVNPVKLYEYIYSGKPVIALKYPESLPFGDFVHLYESRKEFVDLVAQVASGELSPKKPADQCLEFILQNTWESRTREILAFLPKA